jgi:hypothetical protein
MVLGTVFEILLFFMCYLYNTNTIVTKIVRLAAILILGNLRILFPMAIRSSQFMKAVRDVHSFFQEESKIKK